MSRIDQEASNRNYQPTGIAEDRRVAAIAYVAQHCTPRQITALIAQAVAGDEDVIAALAWDGITVDDLRELLRGQGGAQILDQFRWRGRWTGTDPRLFVLSDTEDRGLALIEREGLDPFRVFIYTDALEVRRDVASNDAVGVQTEVVIIGGRA